MLKHRRTAGVAIACATLVLATAAAAQGRGGMGGMGMGFMVGAGRDSATRAQMMVFHELVMNHDRITRTVTNLPNGIRTTTESADPRLAALIKEHVASMNARVAAADDPALPMESSALRAIYRNGARVDTKVEETATGITITQTSSDSAMVAALQQHATEVTDLVNRGQAAMHDAMMRNAPPGRKP
ncbi:MAG TPA: hypothetical protein VG916_09420 [Gemmatimonadaceae bacterium]|nr:hypothetical protein [Gemmatimonadaceae bacterium]